jgi:pilus assembly protein CpaE
MTVQWIGLVEDKDLRKEIDHLVGETGRILQSVKGQKELHQAITHFPQTVVFLQSNSDHDVFELCRELSVLYPFISLILLVKEKELDVKKAMRVGAMEIISFPINGGEIIQVVKEAEEMVSWKATMVQKDTAPIQKKGQIITVCSTKGGVGKTTITVNLAIALAKQKQKVVVLDLDLQFGDVAMHYDIHPKRTIYEWVKEYEQSQNDIKEYIIEHSSGVDILSSPSRPEFAEEISEKHIGSLLTKLKEHYDWIVIDTSPSLVETGLMALEHSDHILLVTSMDLPTLKNNKLYVDTLDSLNLKRKIMVIVNRDFKTKGIEVETVEKILGLPTNSRIPNEEKIVISSINTGVPVILTHPRSKVAKNISLLAAILTKETHQKGKLQNKPSKRSFISRLLKK